MSPNNADEMANSVDPDQTAVWSGSALFAQTYLSENYVLRGTWYRTWSKGDSKLLRLVFTANSDLNNVVILTSDSCVLFVLIPLHKMPDL